MIRTTYIFPTDIHSLNRLDQVIEKLPGEEQSRHGFEVYIPPQPVFYVARAWIDATHTLRTDYIQAPLAQVQKVVHVYG